MVAPYFKMQTKRRHVAQAPSPNPIAHAAFWPKATNCASLAYAANVASSIADGLARARVAIESGAAKAKLAQFVAFGQNAA